MKLLKTIPDKMKVLNLYDINDLRLDIKDTPKVEKNAVLINIKYCGICSSDIERVFQNGTYHFPTIIGHEFGGIIVGVNDGDENLLGKKVAVFPLLPCFECDACKKEEYAQCKSYNYFGSRCDGGFSEYLVVPKWNLVFNDNLDYKLLALCEPSAVALHAIKRINIENNSKVFVMGSGTIGLLIALFLKEKGHKVYVGARKQANIDFIKDLGLNPFDTNNVLDELENHTDNNGFKYICEVIGSNESLNTCLTCASNFSQIVIVGNPKSDINLPKDLYWKILRKQISLTGTWNSSYTSNVNDWKDALKHMEDNQNLFKRLISHTFKIDDYKQAFSLLKDSKEFKTKVMLEVSEVDEKR